MLAFVKCFFFISWDNHVNERGINLFPFHSINVTYYIDLLSYIEPFLLFFTSLFHLGLPYCSVDSCFWCPTGVLVCLLFNFFSSGFLDSISVALFSYSMILSSAYLHLLLNTSSIFFRVVIYFISRISLNF